MGAPEKRREKRFRRRLRVVFEAEGTRAGGYTTNLSERGMQVSSAVVFPAGSMIIGKVELPDGVELTVSAKVRWARKTQGTFSIMREKSMGLEIVGDVPAELLQMLEGAREDSSRIPETAVGQSREASAAVSRRIVTPAAAPPVRIAPTPARRPPAPPPAPVTAAAPPPRVARPTPSPAPPAGVRVPSAPAATTRSEAKPATSGAGIEIGLEGTAGVSIVAPDSPLTPTPAVALIEEAVDAALAERLPADLQSRGLDLTLTIIDSEPLPVGSSVQAQARVQEITGNGRFVKLSVELSEMGRPLATATHTRVLVRSRSR